MISMAETTLPHAIQEAIDLLNRDISSHDVPYAIGRARAAHRALLQATQAIGESMADADPDSHGTDIPPVFSSTSL